MAEPAAYDVDPRVDDYLAPLPPWQQQVCQRVRELAHEADPEMQETIKRTVQPYFVLQGNVIALLAAKDHVNVFTYDGGLAADPSGLVSGGHGNVSGRTIAIHEGEEIDEAALLVMLRAIVALNRAGGWRKASRSDA